MYSPHRAKERNYSCLLHLSNIMPLSTVTAAPSVQYPFSETCSYVSKCPEEYHTSEHWCITPCIKHQQLFLQCPVLQNFHLTEIAIHDSLWYRHCNLFFIFDDHKSTQT